MPFGKAVEILEDFMGMKVSQVVAKGYTHTAGEAYVVMQEEEVRELEQKMPEAAAGVDKLQFSADGAMVPLLHGVWAEVRTLVLGEVCSRRAKEGTEEVFTRNLSYFSRKMNAQEYQRQSLVEVQRRGVENARVIAAVMDGAEWEQGLVDFHCPRAIRILDFAHAVQHLNIIGESLYGEHTPQSQAWLNERAHRLKHEGPEGLLHELTRLQRKYPQSQVLASNLAYLKKRKDQLRYPLFQALGWPIGSGIVESGNKLVVEARLKGAGMHWAENHVNPMLAIRNILCSGRWKEEWPRIEARLRRQTHLRRSLVHRSHHPTLPTTLVARALQGHLDDLVPEQPPQAPVPPKPKKNPWRNFKYGKTLYAPSPPPKK
jgi:hypothetical protein